MSIFDTKASAGQSTEIPSEANHPGALVAIIDLGTHSETFKNEKGEKTADVRKIYLIFELDEKMTGATGNHVIGKEYNLGSSPKSGLRKMMEGWRGKAYAEGEEIAISKALGKPCLVNVVHGTSASDNVYAKIGAIAGLPKGMTPFKPTLPLTIWEIGCSNPFPDYSWLPYSFLNRERKPLSDILKASKEMNRGQTPPASAPPANTGHMAPPPSQDEQEIPF